MTKNKPILQKLRAEIEELIKGIGEPPTRFQEGRLCGYKEALSLLNELEKETQYQDLENPVEECLKRKKSWEKRQEKETQPLMIIDSGIEKVNGKVQYKPVEEPQPDMGNIEFKNTYHDFGWTPTPGDLIEVSNDGEKWEQAEFLKVQGFLIPFSDEIDRKYCTVEYSGKVNTWKYARPAPEELKPLSDYTYDTHFHHAMPNVWQSNLAEQVEAITKYLNK